MIGHFVFDPEYYLSWKELEKFEAVDYFYFDNKNMPNKHWPLMLKRSLNIISFAKYIDIVNQFIPGGNKHIAILNHFTSRDTRNYLIKTEPHIKFINQEIKTGKAYLNQCGLSESDKYVCVISRDAVYKNKYLNESGRRDWSYHSYRNSNIENYQKSINDLAEKGFFVFRMGKGVEKKIDESHSKVIDYACSNDRSDFLDIFLFANSTFSIGSEAGIITTTFAYRVPYCSTNISAIETLQAWHNNNLIILKKYWLKIEKRFMTFEEIFKCGAGLFLRTEQYNKLGIELIENTPDEILNVSIEMQQRLNGTWETNEEYEFLQKQFWKIFPKSKWHGKINARIGAEYLRQNRALLD